MNTTEISAPSVLLHYWIRVHNILVVAAVVLLVKGKVGHPSCA